MKWIKILYYVVLYQTLYSETFSHTRYNFNYIYTVLRTNYLFMLSRIKNAISIATVATYYIYRKTEFVCTDKETNKTENPKWALHRNECKHKEICLFNLLRAKKSKLSVKGVFLPNFKTVGQLLLCMDCLYALISLIIFR